MGKDQKKMDFSSIGDVFAGLSKKTSIIVEQEQKEKKFINTGNYVLNALLSKNIRKGGVSDNRLTIFAGPPGCGKSYLCYNIARNAQNDGYRVIYIDTEYAIELEELQRFGIDTDPEKLILIRNNKVEDLKIALATLLDEMKKQQQNGVDIGKNLIVLDSIGQLASNKELEDAKDAKIKVDMSRAKGLKSLFRVITADMGYLGIPMIGTNHVYMSQDLFPTAIMGGGEGVMYSASTVVFMSIAKLKSGDESTDSKAFVKDIGQSGIIVTAKSRKNRLAKPMQIKFEIDFDEGTNPFKGLEAFCTEENYEKVGIAKGKADKDGNFQPGGIKYYVRHLEKTLYEKEIFTDEVFTEEVLDKLEPIIESYFSYASYEEQKKAYSKMQREIQEEVEKQEEAEAAEVEEVSKTKAKKGPKKS
jgi:RecA/RadA recombinase